MTYQGRVSELESTIKESENEIKQVMDELDSCSSINEGTVSKLRFKVNALQRQHSMYLKEYEILTVMRS
jgi:hypothetical protein